MAQTRLQAVREENDEVPTAAPNKVNAMSLGLLMTGLKVMSQRAMVALASLVDGAMIASVFVLWLMIIGNPSVLQLVAVGLYAAFILLCLYVRTIRRPTG